MPMSVLCRLFCRRTGANAMWRARMADIHSSPHATGVYLCLLCNPPAAPARRVEPFVANLWWNCRLDAASVFLAAVVGVDGETRRG